MITRSPQGRMKRIRLPSVMTTALGTFVSFDRGGVSYTVIGSVPPAAAEAAARGL